MTYVMVYDLLDLEPNSSFATRPDQPESPRSGNEVLEGLFLGNPNLSGMAL